MNSPRTGKPMVSVEYHKEVDFHVDVCADTGGMWFDKGELGRMFPDLALCIEQMDWKPAPGAHAPVTSPRSGAVCEPVAIRDGCGLVLDRDPATGGFWLDGGELGHLQDFLAKAKAESQAHAAWVHEQMLHLGYEHHF